MDFFTGNQSINEQVPITPQTSQNRMQSNTTPPSFNSPTFIQQPNEFMCLVCKEKFPSEETRFAHLSNTSIPCHAETPLLFRTACILCLKDCETVSLSQVEKKTSNKNKKLKKLSRNKNYRRIYVCTETNGIKNITSYFTANGPVRNDACPTT